MTLMMTTVDRSKVIDVNMHSTCTELSIQWTEVKLLMWICTTGVHWEWEFPFPVLPMGIPWECEWTTCNLGKGMEMGIMLRGNGNAQMWQDSGTASTDTKE